MTDKIDKPALPEDMAPRASTLAGLAADIDQAAADIAAVFGDKTSEEIARLAKSLATDTAEEAARLAKTAAERRTS